MVSSYSYEKEKDTLRVFFEKREGDSFTQKIANDVFMLKGMTRDKINGIIVKNASKDTEAKQKAIEKAGIDGFIIRDLIAEK